MTTIRKFFSFIGCCSLIAAFLIYCNWAEWSRRYQRWQMIEGVSHYAEVAARTKINPLPLVEKWCELDRRLRLPCDYQYIDHLWSVWQGADKRLEVLFRYNPYPDAAQCKLMESEVDQLLAVKKKEIAP